ncbi:MAG TPA: hypothetical protein VFU47_16545, partial [Armatimonadota bacterium]|nr:hypothetical protein [Armatimonadota bacterium]
LLLNNRSQVLFGASVTQPLQRALPFPDPALLLADPDGSGVSGRGDNAEVLAWSRLPLDEYVDAPGARTPVLYAATRRSAADAFGPLRAVHRWMLLIGLLTLIISVSLGYWLADLLVVRQVRKLAQGMRELARGDFQQAASIAEELTERHRKTG